MPAERACAVFDLMPDAPLRPAPVVGQHTREIAHRVLGLTMMEIDELIAAGVLEDTSAAAAASERSSR
jgi:crotonobetainyl-CoA:carnitine CoA-transferase CaiB-like acyl-CoA transferase